LVIPPCDEARRDGRQAPKTPVLSAGIRLSFAERDLRHSEPTKWMGLPGFCRSAGTGAHRRLTRPKLARPSSDQRRLWEAVQASFHVAMIRLMDTKLASARTETCQHSRQKAASSRRTSSRGDAQPRRRASAGLPRLAVVLAKAPVNVTLAVQRIRVVSSEHPIGQD